MIKAAKALAKRFWPALRLRTILLAILLFAAAMPGISAIFLRVYENTLVRQTEAELVAQGAALAAAGQALWPGARPSGASPPPPAPDRETGYYQPEPVTIDLSTDPVLPERPPATPAAAPIDPDAQALATAMGPIIDQTSRTTLASILLLDRRGRVIHGFEAGGSQAQLPEVRAALAGDSRTVLRRNGAYHPRYSFEWLSRASALRIHHARPILAGDQVVGVLLMSRSPRALFRGMYEDRLKIVLGIGLIFGILVVLSGLVSRGVARPIEALSAASRDVAAGQGSIPDTPATAAIEIRALYEDFRAMAEAISRRSRYLRDFAAAVSHEFKTPLAGIRGGVELLEDHHATMSEADRRRFLGNIAADTERLSQLVTRLLDLARADMARPEAGIAADLAAAVRRVADGFAAPGFEVGVVLPGTLRPVSVPEEAIETVLTALVENARQAGATLARVEVREGREATTLAVTDDGPGVPVADRERLFEPFFTSRRAEGGTGLGLTIARSLLAAHQARIALADSPAGARFDVTLPQAHP
jgi:two-component system sensor histidine kinase ChvG